MKKIINYIKSLGWEKKDVKNILMLVIMLLIACVILNKYLNLNVKVQGSVGLWDNDSIRVRVIGN